jgi:hypothetical protein
MQDLVNLSSWLLPEIIVEYFELTSLRWRDELHPLLKEVNSIPGNIGTQIKFQEIP